MNEIGNEIGDEIGDRDYASDYFALRAENDQRRESGRQWLWETLSRLCAMINAELGAPAEAPRLQVARQEWQFTVGTSIMVGERYGARYRGRTLVIEVGWPREPAHGFVPDQGLARGRVSLSLSPIIEAKVAADLILKTAGPDAAWHVIKDHRTVSRLDEAQLRAYLQMILAD